MDDLKPCPFCGGAAQRITISDEAAAPERRTLGRIMANAAFYAEYDRAEALQAERDEAMSRAEFAEAQLQHVLDMSPPPPEGLLKKRLLEVAARKKALAEARDKALEEAAVKIQGGPMVMHPHEPSNYIQWPWWGTGNRHYESELATFARAGAAAIRAMKGERG